MCRSVPQIALAVTSSTTSSGSSMTASSTVWTPTSRVPWYTTACIPLPARDDDFAGGAALLDQAVRLAQGGRVDRAQLPGHGGADRALGGPPAHRFQQRVPLAQVARPVQRPGEHELPAERDALVLQRVDVQA